MRTAICTDKRRDTSETDPSPVVPPATPTKPDLAPPLSPLAPPHQVEPSPDDNDPNWQPKTC